MKDLNEFARGEVKISRIEFAEKCAKVTNRITDRMMFDTPEGAMKAKMMLTAFLSMIMEEVFENSELEVEED